MSDEELDNVAGGFSGDTAQDGKEITHDEAIAHVKANFQKIRSID